MRILLSNFQAERCEAIFFDGQLFLFSLFARNFSPGAASFRQPNRDRLFSTRDPLPVPSASLCSSLAFTHRPTHLLGGFLAISSHKSAPLNVFIFKSSYPRILPTLEI